MCVSADGCLGRVMSGRVCTVTLYLCVREGMGHYTANEGPMRIQYKCLVPIYVFPEMKLRRFVISKTEL